jgi:hypothetical protein
LDTYVVAGTNFRYSQFQHTKSMCDGDRREEMECRVRGDSRICESVLKWKMESGALRQIHKDDVTNEAVVNSSQPHDLGNSSPPHR